MAVSHTTSEADPRRRFSATVGDYARYRPGYPRALVQWVADRVPAPATVVDLGCGTGLSARPFLEAGYRVVGVEPNADMRAVAEARGLRCVDGEAAPTGLDPGTADLAIAGQAVHWFDLDAVLPEIRRVVGPPAVGVAFWNRRADGPLMDAYDALLRGLTEYVGTPKALETIARLHTHPLVKHPEEARFDHTQRLDRAGLVGRAWSSSYVARGVTDRAAFDAALMHLVDRFGEDGVVQFRYETRALAFTVAS